MRYQSLDAWRGVACLLVIVFHATYYAGNTTHFTELDLPSALIRVCEGFWIGVPMFFVISGYCISATAAASVRKGQRTREYFQRRITRIFPPYLICLAISALFVAVFESLRPGLFADDNHAIPTPLSLGFWQWIGNLTLTEGWRDPLLAGDEGGWFLAHAWTLGYEEQFYAVTGLLLLVAPKRFFGAAALVTLAVALARPWTRGIDGVWFNGYWLHFGAGIAVYYMINHGTAVSRPMCLLAIFGGLAIACRDVLNLSFEEAGRRELGDIVAFSFAILLVLLHPFDKKIVSSEWMAPFSLCGTMCYSLYLVHWPICKAISHLFYDAGLTSDLATMLVTVPACLAVSLGVGWLFHVHVERRFLNTAAKPAAPAAAVNPPAFAYATGSPAGAGGLQSALESRL